jgi:hypothetical protein
MRWSRVLVPFVLILAACGGKPAATPAPAATPPLLARYPALRWVPAEATYAVTATSLRDAAAIMRELVSAFGIPVDVGPGHADDAMREALGLSVMVVEDLAAAGLDLDGGTAIFSHALHPVLVLPVADAERLRGFADAFRAERSVGVRQIMGHAVYRWDAGGGSALEWAHIDDWLLLYWGPAGATDDLRWLQAALGTPAGGGIATSPDFEAAAGPLLDLEALPPIVGVGRPAALRRHLSAALPGAYAGCLEPLTRVQSLALTMGTDWNGADGALIATLDPAAAQTLREHRPAPAPSGMATLRDQAAVYAAIGLDLHRLGRALSGTGCPAVAGLAPALAGAPQAIDAVAVELDAGRLEGRGAVHLAIPGRDFVTPYLDQIPRRSWFESDARISGVEVTVLDVPAIARITYRLTDRSFTAAYGRDMAEAVWGRGGEVEGGELAAAGLVPERITDLPAALRLIGDLIFPYGMSREYAERAAARLARYRYGRVAAGLDGDRLVIEGHMRLRR